MTANIPNAAPFLKTSRLFPSDLAQLTVEVNKAYLDTANAINSRTIGIFPVNVSSITGESWFLNNRRQQSLRQVYQFTAAGNIPHNLNLQNISQFSRCFGSFTDGTNFYGAIYASNVAIAGQVSFFITPTNIVVLSGAGAPAIVSGLVVIEWLSNI